MSDTKLVEALEALKTCRKNNTNILDNCLFPDYGLAANLTPDQNVWRKIVQGWNKDLDKQIKELETI